MTDPSAAAVEPQAPPLSRQDALAALTAPGAPYELGERTIRGAAQRVFMTGPDTLRTLFADTVSDATFTVYEDERLTFAEAYATASQLAHALIHQYGVAKGDRVAISMRNFPEWMLAFTAVTSIGAIAVAMNALWRPDELEYGLLDSGATVLFADQERLDRLAQCSNALDVKVIAVRATRVPEGAAHLNDLLANVGAVQMPEAVVAPEDGAIIAYTSGSTGRPKGVLSTHRNVLAALLSWELDAQAALLMAGLTAPPPVNQPATLMAVPLFHVTGSHAVYLASYRAQRKLVCMYKWDAELAAALIEREKISSFIAPAAMTGDLVREAQRSQRDLSTLVAVGGGGAPRAPEQVKQIDASFANAMPGTAWGMTETNAIGAGIGGADYLARPTSCGRCSAVLELMVSDDDGKAVPAGERGELLVRGTSVFPGYWNRPDVNAEVFRDGWFRTGDVAVIDADGFVYIVDRIKDLIIRGGENIGCGQVEAALLMHPDVQEAAVYAVPDERLGEEVGATIYGAPSLNLDAVRAFLGEHLAKFEVPRYMVAANAPLPRTASGKILKREIRETALEGMKSA